MVLFHSEQIQGQTIDIITGFKLTDGEMQLYVLEGLRHGAMKELTKQNFRYIQPGKMMSLLLLLSFSSDISLIWLCDSGIIKQAEHFF